MKNFEKYEKEIKEAMVNYNVIACIEKISGIEFNFIDMFNWLYEDYKEPLLTDEEREYLKAVIKPFKSNIKDLVFYSNCIYIELNGDNSTRFPSARIPVEMLKSGLRCDKRYSLAELGLED